ncbi:MAG: flavin reductase family protein [Bryobacteraceae bacterium]
MPLSPEALRRVCSEFATGIAVVTCRASEGEPHGLTVNSFTSVSAQPPLILVCIDHNCSVLPVLRTASHFAVNVLHADQIEISNRFAQFPEGRFEGVEWCEGTVAGTPLIAGSLAAIECAVRTVIDQGDHAIFVGEAEDAVIGEGRPLLYFRSRYEVL